MAACLLLPAGLAAAPEGADPAPGLGITSGGAAYLLQLVLGLGVVIAAILVLGFVLRRTGGVGGRLSGEFRVLGSVSLGARERMVLVQVGEQQLVLGVAPGQVRTLHVLDQPLEPRGTAAPAGEESFTARLRAAMGARGESS
ncbi:flagellar biosynthetic protein FliO [Ectothiorhodospira mobilis]|uniref:flagellar biosynthetic protein FliO n=1 Tax=Ectothiorhodospira mobilis TaxID=195064 RepID=UPI001F5B0A4D|nr:flagellar biosynthetic protein FliO [Ectothiorhodospira mobilis]